MPPRQCLIVDDNEPFAENIADIVADEGMCPAVAVSPASALALLRQRRFDVLVTDLSMPQMNGAALLHEARRLDPGLPAIAVSAFASDATFRRAEREGFLAIFDKLDRVDTLVASIRAARRDGLVAVVEDDRLLAQGLSDAVSARGFTPLFARTAAETGRLSRFGLCAALVDLMLPDSPDGQVLDQLACAFPRLPLLVLTAHQELTRVALMRRLFPKPFELTAVLDELEAVYAAPHP
jgi:DNA-binding NtrC family response regulator